MFTKLSKITKFLSNTVIVVLLTVFAYSFSFVAHADYSATTTFSTATTTGTFIVPAGVTSLTVSLTAAGGGGGGGAFTYGGGGGGAGSSIQNIIISVTPGQNIPYTVGVGGAFGTAGSFSIGAGNGNNGGNSTFGTSFAFGGFGGQGAIYGLGNGIGGIAGGIGGTNGTDGASQFGPQRTYGGNGGTTPFGTGGQGAYGDTNTSLPAAVAGTNGNGGGGASGWGYSDMSLGLAANTASRGGNGFIQIAYYVDTTSPTITILGTNPLTLNASSTGIYTDAGATAFDAYYGTTTATTTFNNVNLAATGTYSVIYTATDLAGNATTSTRTVNVVDVTVPTIVAPATQIFEATGATTTPTLVLPIVADDFSTTTLTYTPASFGLGTTTVVWTVTDTSGNFATTSSDVVIRDTTGPAIVLNGVTPMSVMFASVYTDQSATAADLVFGTTSVSATGTVNTMATGTYAIVYTSVDGLGNTSSSTRIVNVVATAPVLTTLTIAPLNPTLTVGSNTTFVATTLDQYGSPFASSVSWGSYNPTVGTIGFASGVFNALAVGTTTVQVNSGALVATTTVTVSSVPPVLTSISIAPLNTSITLGATTTFVSTTLDQYGMPFATSTSWLSSSSTVGSINPVTGLFTALSLGTTTVSGTAGSLSTSTTVTVSNVPPVLTTVILSNVNPLPLTLTVGATTTMIATVLDQYSNPFATTTTFTSSSSTVGSINPLTGLFSALSVGTTTVSLTAGSLPPVTTVVTVIPVPASDITPPSTPVITGVSATGTIITLATTSWTNSTDAGSGLAGYLYVFDNNAGTIVSTTTPGVATTTATTTTSATFGTRYFHVAAIDNAGNISGTASYGPLVISDSQVLYRNSTVGGTFYNLFSPSLAQSVIASTTGTTTITNSTLSTFWNVNNSTVTTTTIDNSTFNNVVSTNSIILNSNATNCTIINSSVDGYTLANCYIANSTLDPGAFINSTSTFSTIIDSYIYDSIIANSSVSTSTINGSTLSFATVTFSNIATSSLSAGTVVTNSNVTLSTLVNSQLTGATSTNSILTNTVMNGGTITNSTSTGSTLTNTIVSAGSVVINSTTTNSTIASSTLTNVVMASSSITGTVLSNASTTNAVIVNGVINSGTITIGGNTYVITVPTLISSLTGTVSGVNLLSTANFAILSQSGITNIPTSAITGDIGTSPISGTNIGLTCPEVSGVVYSVDAAGPSCRITNPALLTAAVNDMGTAYTDAAGRTNPNATELGAGNIGGMTLAPGLYKWSTGVTIPTDVTLSGSSTAVWIFQIAGNLDIASGPSVASGTKVILTGGAQASNIFWQVGGGAGATLGTYSTFNGTILSATQVVMQTGAVLNGRALAQTLVTLDQNTVSNGSTPIPDTTAPVISITGLNPLTIVATSTPYADAGATAFDLVDGIVVASTTFNNVNAAVVGTYSVVYSAIDAALNATTSTRVVNVVATPDTTAPAITIAGANPATVTLGSVYTDAGATAFDLVSGTTTVNSTSTVNTAAIGTYAVNYSSTDGAGNTATSSRVVNVIAVPDTTAPVITVQGSNPVTTVTGSIYLDAGATAFDTVDGNVTASIVTTNPVSSSTPVGTYTVIYTVSDIAGNVASSTRTVNVVATPDVTAPVITILGTNPVNIIVGGLYTDAGATSTDNIDGNLTASIVTTNLVNTAVVGSYSVTYAVVDGAGNGATSTRTVNVIATPTDTVPPVITITGGTPITLTVGAVYTDLGATAFDAVDGTTTATILSNNVNTAVVGSYTVVYTATDIAGNNATATRDVNIVAAPADTISPVITITGGTPLTFAATTTATYTDAGATYTDNVDGGPFTATTTPYTVDLTTVGSYTVVYTANDVAGNISSATRNVNVIVGSSTADVIPPVITITGGTPVTITVGSVYTDLGATALDAVDGPVAASITANTVNNTVVGTYTVTYTATDIAGNIANAIRTVNVIAAPADTVAPVITITGGTPITVAASSTYSDLGATAFDAVSGTTTVVVASNNVNIAIIGSYSVVYTSTDVAGNVATATRAVNVVASSIPAVSVLGANPMTITQTLPYTELGASSIDSIDGNISAGIVVTGSGSVNTAVIGSYIVVYTSTNSGGLSASSSRTVNVVADTIAPVITIAGANPATVLVGGSYLDAGAAALDAVSGVTAVTSTSTVNTTAIGSYAVTYSSTDGAGNLATAVRVVNVISGADITPPVITITGGTPVSVTIGSVYADAGATAFDTVDGVVLASTTSNNVNTAVIASYSVTYSATDIAGNVANATRIVNVVAAGGGGRIGGTGLPAPIDSVKPVITILGNNPATVATGSTYTDAGATALDNIAGDLTTKILVINTVNIFTPGTYTVTYMVSDPSGNSATAIRTVTVGTSANNNPAPATTTSPAVTPVTPVVPPATTPATDNTTVTSDTEDTSATDNGGEGITIPSGVGQIVSDNTTSEVLGTSTASTTELESLTNKNNGFVATALEGLTHLSTKSMSGIILVFLALLLIGFFGYKRYNEEGDNNVHF